MYKSLSNECLSSWNIVFHWPENSWNKAMWHVVMIPEILTIIPVAIDWGHSGCHRNVCVCVNMKKRNWLPQNQSIAEQINTGTLAVLLVYFGAHFVTREANWNSWMARQTASNISFFCLQLHTFNRIKKILHHNIHGGFQSHGGTPVHHPFLDGIFPL